MSHKNGKRFKSMRERREAFLGVCPVCGKPPRYSVGTNVVSCSHEGTEFAGQAGYYRLISANAERVAMSLFAGRSGNET